ncbi:MAG TPA: Eco57I restriction-modification methylase domain-containing protein [Solirubrobacterales bacterium]|nr:Eco57I restriction-modification methylase domain-containing protein [Solirubrobacterales bacterium]
MPAEDPRHFPDILDCLAQLSSDEVPTPPRLASEMLDLLPATVWRNPQLRWLDPCSKSGAFLREIVRRLIEGLAEWQPDFEKRREYILREMVFGAAITEITGYITRRTVYCSRDASGDYSVVRFDDEAGNLPFVAAQHDFEKGSCTLCGAPEELERGAARENYAYAFIHRAYPEKEKAAMKFDVIVGNPPYQISSNGSTRTKPIYQRFVQEAIAMNPRYVLMITPSRWFAGGLGLKEFRAEMLKDRRLSHLVDYRVEKDVFPKVNVNGGVSYFLWDSEHDGKCLVSHVPAGGSPSVPEARYLDEFDLLVRQNEGVRILRKVKALGEPTFEQRVSAQKPFDLHTNFKGAATKRGLTKPLRMHSPRAVSWVPRAKVTKSLDLIDRWKVFLVAASDGNETFPAPIWDLAKGPFVGAPGEICNGSYLVVYPTDDEATARTVVAFLRTRFVRFLVSLRKIAQHNDAGRFAFVPDLAMDREWTDEQLYERYGLSDGEISFIESQIKEMPAPELAAK